jgi:hypothetical protein
LSTAYSSLGAVAVYSREAPGLALVAVREDGRLKLDTRGYQRATFIHTCAAAGSLGTATCACTFDRARAEGQLPEGPLTSGALAPLRADALSCGATNHTSSGLRESTPR